MKKVIILILILLINLNFSYAVEEVDLEKEHINLDYFSDVYYGKAENVSPALKLFSKKGLEFKNSPVNSVKLNFLYSGHLTYTHKANIGNTYNHQFNTVEPGITVNFNNNKSKAVFEMNLTRHFEGYTNRFSEKISFAYLSHDITPNQKVIFGQYTRLPMSIDGAKSVYAQDMIGKTQLGRTLGNVFSVGLRNIADYKYVDYDIGLYDSTRYMKNFYKGIDFTGQIGIKPLAGICENRNKLRIGASYNIGKNDISYHQYSLFSEFNRDKFHAIIEYANANGYNGVYQSKNSAEGLYTTIGYDITPKLTVLGRFDIFDPNTHLSKNTSKEYTIGITYKLFENLKLMLNYVFSEGHNKPTTNAIMFATRFII